MPTNLAIDDELLREAQRLGKHRSKRETVMQALTEYVERHRRKDILELAGRIDWDAGYDHKAERRGAAGRGGAATAHRGR